jgi:hypothetical protein
VDYTFTVPTTLTEKYMTLNLYLVDPVKQERFSDAMIAIVELLTPVEILESGMEDEVYS